MEISRDTGQYKRFLHAAISRRDLLVSHRFISTRWSTPKFLVTRKELTIVPPSSSSPFATFPIFPRITILFFPISFHYRRNIVQKGSNDSRKVILAYRAFPFDIRKVYSVIGGTVAQEKSIVSLEKGEKLVRKACVNVYSWDQGNGEAEAHISLWVRYTSKEFASWLTVPTWFILTKKRGKGFFHEKKEGTIEKGTGQLL